MSALAFEGEVLGYGQSSCCSPCGNRRQVVNTINGLYGDITFAEGAGINITIDGNVITITNTSLSGSSNVVYDTLQGSGGLEEIDTIGIVDQLFWVIESGIVRGWRLTLGVAATDIPNGIMRPSGAEALTKNFIREI